MLPDIIPQKKHSSSGVCSSASVLLFRQKKSGVILGGVLGITLMAWITIQFVIFPSNFMSNTYFIFGILQALTGFATLIFYKQEHFAFQATDYPNVGQNPDTLGFWWCGRYGMHGWEMPIKEIGIDLASYQKVIICSPIWVFALASPMRSFCRAAAGKIKSADYILTHHVGVSFSKVADDMDEILGLRRENFSSFRCHAGKYKETRR